MAETSLVEGRTGMRERIKACSNQPHISPCPEHCQHSETIARVGCGGVLLRLS
jgi:hypothetical protein